jgi:ribosomal protein L11 methyltransferase
LGRGWPALDAGAGDPDLLLAAVDDFGPTAVEERGDGLRVFFATPAARDRAVDALPSQFRVSSVDVPDEDWARRSQENLSPITVGRITIVPTLSSPPALPAPPAIVIAIPPSMGFGTGHHATTRLCLAALQTLDLREIFVLDVGTGSGVLAIAAMALGAASALGIDDDADAIQAARENLALNGLGDLDDLDDLTRAKTGVLVADLMTADLPKAGCVIANITGAMLIRAAGRLVASVQPGGVLILSGVLSAERDDVRRAFAGCDLVAEAEEDGWLALTLRLPG